MSARLGRALVRAGDKIGRPVIAVPAGPLGSFPPQTLRPGAAVSAGYSSGDLRIGAIGTVAYTDAGRVWAFGHSFEAAGARSRLLQELDRYRETARTACCSRTPTSSRSSTTPTRR